jgi:hypothetical protein
MSVRLTKGAQCEMGKRWWPIALQASATADLESPKVKSMPYMSVGKKDWGNPEFDADCRLETNKDRLSGLPA